MYLQKQTKGTILSRHVDTYREIIKKIKEVIAIKVKILLIYREEGMVYVGVRSQRSFLNTGKTLPVGLDGGYMSIPSLSIPFITVQYTLCSHCIYLCVIFHNKNWLWKAFNSTTTCDRTLSKLGIQGGFLNLIKFHNKKKKTTANTILTGKTLEVFPLKAGTKERSQILLFVFNIVLKVPASTSREN